MNTLNDLNYKLAPNFALKEFKVSSDHPELAEKISFSLEDVLTLRILCLECAQPIRDKFGTVMVLSGKRDEELNSAVGGSKTSDHLTCNAADLFPLDFHPERVFKWIVKESNIPYRQVIYYPSQRFIHISSNIPQKQSKHDALVCKEAGQTVGFYAYYKQ